MMEHDAEPVRGLPGYLPEGERIVWQGAPDARLFLKSALFGRWIVGYFVVLAAFAFLTGGVIGMGATLLAGAVALGLFAGFAALVARTTVYTITNRRIVLRIGVALNKCINLPLHLIGAAEMRSLGGTAGEIALSLTGRHRLGYAVLWPHARPWRFGKPQPMLRALPDAHGVAEVLAEQCAAVAPIERGEVADQMTTPPLREAAA